MTRLSWDWRAISTSRRRYVLGNRGVGGAAYVGRVNAVGELRRARSNGCRVRASRVSVRRRVVAVQHDVARRTYVSSVVAMADMPLEKMMPARRLEDGRRSSTISLLVWLKRE